MRDANAESFGALFTPLWLRRSRRVQCSTCYCGVEDLLRIIRRRYSLAVMNAIRGHPKPRYHDIAESLSGINSSTLAGTVRALETAQLLRRHPGDNDSRS